MNSIFFQAAGKPGLAVIASMIRDVVCFVPLILILPLFFPSVETILYAAPISDLIAMIVTAILSIYFVRSLREVEEKQRRYERQIREYRRGAILCDGESRKKKALLKEKAAAKYEEYRKYCVDNKVAIYPERTRLVGIGDETY